MTEPPHSVTQAHLSPRLVSPINAQPCSPGFALIEGWDRPSGGVWRVQGLPMPLEYRKRPIVGPQAQHPLAGVADHARGLEYHLNP